MFSFTFKSVSNKKVLLEAQTFKIKYSHTVVLLFARRVSYTSQLSLSVNANCGWEWQASKWGFVHKQERGVEW